MNNLLNEQATILLLAAVGSLAWLIKKTIEFAFDLISKRYSIKEQRVSKIIEKQTEIELIELQKISDRKNQLEDYKLKRLLDRNALHDGLEIIRILKKLRETVNAASVSIIAFHNGIAKNYKNFSMRFQETRNIGNFTKENYQVLPLSSYYEEIEKFETQDYLIFKNTDDTSLKHKSILSENNIYALVIFPILVLVTDNNDTVDSIMSIIKNENEYFIIGCLLLSLDNKTDLENIEKIVQPMKNSLYEIINIYEKNNVVLS